MTRIFSILIVLSFTTQQADRSTMDRVFTREQALRGRDLVIKVGCGNCHNSDLRGIEETPGLIGERFIGRWNGRTLKDLDTQLTSMPSDGSYKMTPRERVEVIAFLLGVNDAPVGDTEMGTDERELARIRIRFP